MGLGLNCLDTALCVVGGFILGWARTNLDLGVDSSSTGVKLLVIAIKVAIRSENSRD